MSLPNKVAHTAAYRAAAHGSPQRVAQLGGSGTVTSAVPHNSQAGTSGRLPLHDNAGGTTVGVRNTISTFSSGPPGDDTQSADKVRFSPSQPLYTRLANEAL